MQFLTTVLFVFYGFAILFLLIHSMGMAYLALQYRNIERRTTHDGGRPVPTNEELPDVTVQLPIFNEKYVIERLIDVVAEFDYPQDKYEIQVLDDSTDETSDIVAAKVREIADRGINISHVRRTDRKGFKAGALKEATEFATGEFIAIFDADFIPQKDFLKKTIPYFSDEKLALVQTRWVHLNEDYSTLTRALAFALDFHFSVEQSGRNGSGHFMNFNGTAGVWRKTAIVDAGGWEADTLTEDLDLSFRAQVKGWKLRFDEAVTSPSELPVTIDGIKSQQFRWMKGGAENARKNLERVFGSDFSFSTKFTAAVHLLSSLVTVSICYIMFASVFFLFYYQEELPNTVYKIISAPMVGISLLYIFSYWTAYSRRHSVPSKLLFLHYIAAFLSFAALFMSLSLYLSRAALEGILNIKSPFVRTPKFSIVRNSDNWREKLDYAGSRISFAVAIETLTAAVFIFASAFSIYLANYEILAFFSLPTAGFITLTYFNIKHSVLR